MSTAYLNDQHFERLSAGSSAQNYVHLAMTAAAEIVVEGCSCVLLGLLTTDKPDSYVIVYCLQCFDAVGWAAGRASGL